MACLMCVQPCVLHVLWHLVMHAYIGLCLSLYRAFSFALSRLPSLVQFLLHSSDALAVAASVALIGAVLMCWLSSRVLSW